MPDAARTQGAEIAIRTLQGNDQLPKWIDAGKAAAAMITAHEDAERRRL